MNDAKMMNFVLPLMNCALKLMNSQPFPWGNEPFLAFCGGLPFGVAVRFRLKNLHFLLKNGFISYRRILIYIQNAGLVHHRGWYADVAAQPLRANFEFRISNFEF